MADGHIWGDASVAYPDMIGTAQLDISMAQRPLGEIVGLDPDAWMIVGMDIGGGEHDHALRVVAIPTELFPEGGDVLPEIAASTNGEIQATEFLVHDVDPYEVLRKVSHLFDFRLRLRRLVDDGIPVRIVAHGDLPERDDTI